MDAAALPAPSPAVSFSGSQKQARDTSRKSDIKQYQTSLEQYANINNGLYPIHAGSAISIDLGSAFCSTELAMGECIIDPKNESPYQYKYISDAVGTNYILWAKLENSESTSYWIVCSNGKSGVKTTAPADATCPL